MELVIARPRLMIAIIALLTIADIALTAIARQSGLIELNPLLVGSNWLSVKLVLTFGVVLYAAYSGTRWPVYATIIALVAVCLWNFIMLSVAGL